MHINPDLPTFVTKRAAALLAKSDPRVATIREAEPIGLLRTYSGELVYLYPESLVGRIIAKGSKE